MVSTASALETVEGTVVIWVVGLMSAIVLVVTGCFDIGYEATDDVWVVSLGLTGRCGVDVFTTNKEVGIVFSLVCATEGSL